MAVIYSQEEKWEEAKRVALAGLELGSVSPKLFWVAGRATVEVGTSPGALVVFRRGLALYPDHELLNSSVAITYARLGEFDKAIEHVRKAIAAAPDNLIYRLDYARLLNDAGHQTESMSEYDWILEHGAVESPQVKSAIVERQQIVDAQKNLN